MTMRIFRNALFLFIFTTTFPSCASADDVAKGKAFFASNCALCHDASSNKAMFQGPPLFGVVGRRIGSVKGFSYSEAFVAANGKKRIWDEAALNTYLAHPDQVMPGTQMPIEVASAQDRKAVIAYLKSLAQVEAKPAIKPVMKPLAKSVVTNDLKDLDWRKDAPGMRHRVNVNDLPKPYATPSAGNSPSFIAPDDGQLPKVPAGFEISVFSRDVDHPRLLRTAPNGDLYVVESGRGRISVFRHTAEGVSATRATFAEGLSQPFGLAFYPSGPDPKYVYVANIGSVVRMPLAGGTAETVVPALSTTGGHSTRDIVFSPDDRFMYVSVGSGSNVAEGMDAAPPGGVAAWQAGHGLGSSWGSEDGRALVLRFAPDGSSRHVLATGIRNCVGLGIRPATPDLYCTTNERDGLGDDLVPDYFTRVEDGQFFGWPWYYLGHNEDPRHRGERPDLANQVTVPDLLFGSHSAPLGFAFYSAEPGAAHAFPPAYQGNAFIALHGSWNRATRTGSKIVRVQFREGRATGEYEDFMTGLILDDKRVSGRPVGVAVGADGALYVSDDTGSKIWKIIPKP